MKYKDMNTDIADPMFLSCVLVATLLGMLALRYMIWILVVVVTLLSRTVLWCLDRNLPVLDKARPERTPTQGWVTVDGCGQPVGSELEVDKVRISEFTHLPVSAATGSAARLRPRSRFVGALELLLGGMPVTVGQLLRGRWTPDLPSASFSAGANFVLAAREEGVRILGGGSVQSDKPKDGVYVICEFSDGSIEVLFPELVARLSAYAVFRDRDATLLSALRLRALEWSQKAGLDWPATHSALLGALRTAWRQTPHELRVLEDLEASRDQSPLWLGSPS